jgi:methionyl-tRNA synthetase
MFGVPTYFLTGTDENSLKNVEAAGASGTSVLNYVDQMSALWQLTWDELGISNDDFIRTTESRHRVGVEKFWRTVSAKPDLIYKGTYEGLYCVGCEAFYRESDLVDGKCPTHDRVAELVKEENYFFRASRFREALLEHIEKHPEFICPEARRNEVVSYITNHLEDFSISRPNKQWGIPVPGDDSQTIYVWFDALLNYMTAVGYGTDEQRFKEWWPAELHIVGKDIIKFHCALWPAMLLAADLPLPRQVFAHGFFTIDGRKVSKSTGNAIDPKDLVETYGVDAVRYFLLREIPFGGDGDFSIARLAARYDSDLASGLGNLVQRVTTLAAQAATLPVGTSVAAAVTKQISLYHEAMSTIALSRALEITWETMRLCDQYLEEKAPWKLRTDPAKAEAFSEIMGEMVEAVRLISWMVLPFMPSTARAMLTMIGHESDMNRSAGEAMQWGAHTGHVQVRKPQTSLFPRFTA